MALTCSVMPPTQDAAARRERLVGYGCAILVVLVWASFSLASRYSARAGLGVRLTPWDLGALRFSVAFAAAGIMWLSGFGRGLPWRRSLVLAVLAGAGFALPSYFGFSLAPAAHGALISSGTLPMMVAIITWAAFGERWGLARFISLALLLLGFILFGTEAYGHQAAPPGAWRGDLLFLCASTSWAVYTVLARRWAPTPAQSIVAVGLWCGALFLPVWWLALPSRLAAAPMLEVALQAAFQGGVAVLVALWLYTRALGSLGPARLTTITAMVPGTAALLAVPLLGEPLGLLSLAGIALVCAAVAVGVGRRSA